MKRFIACILTVVVILTCLTACDPHVAKECEHQWDDGIEVEGGSGAYVMEYTCALCGEKRRETIMIIPPEG